MLKERFGSEVVIDGYKQHEKAFTISPTTTKADRNSMYHDYTDYLKVIDGEEYQVDYIEDSDGLFKFVTKKEKTEPKVLKKQL